MKVDKGNEDYKCEPAPSQSNFKPGPSQSKIEPGPSQKDLLPVLWEKGNCALIDHTLTNVKITLVDTSKQNI